MKKIPAKFGTVMVFGTFDVIHAGHIYFLREAKKLGSELVVSVARDLNVQKIKREKTWRLEKSRAEDLRALGIAEKVVLGGVKNHLPHIKKVAPDIIALGHDQKHYVKNLAKDLKGIGLQTKIV